MAEPALSYCAREVRRHDHDRYLTCLFAPQPEREWLFTLYAFNLEVAKTAEVVSEEMLGRIRLQWWRESLDGLYDGTPRHHQVIEPLSLAVRRQHLDRTLFERLIDARESDLEASQPETLAALEGYAAATSASLVQLALEVLGAGGDVAAIEAGRHVGIAWALTGLLRTVPFHARRRRCYLPGELTRAAGLALGDLFELRQPPELAQAVEPVAERARYHLTAARRLRQQVPKAALPALLPATLAARYLAILRRAGHDPQRPEVQARPAGNAWRLSLSALARRY